MALDSKIVAKLAVSFLPQAYIRLTPRAHAGTPLGMGFGETRFASPTRSFHILYIARNLETGIAEAIIRDRFEKKAARELDMSEVDQWAVAEVSATMPLTLLDLRTTGLLQLGVSTDAARAKAQIAGRRLSQTLYDSFDVDGLLYLSRLTGAECIAIYDRAVARKLTVTQVVDLARLADLVPALMKLNVTLIREPRGSSPSSPNLWAVQV